MSENIENLKIANQIVKAYLENDCHIHNKDVIAYDKPIWEFQLIIQCDKNRKSEILEYLLNNKCKGVFTNYDEYPSGELLFIVSFSEESSYNACDFILGPDDGSRDSNEFFVYG